MLGIGGFLFQDAEQSFRSEGSLTVYDEGCWQEGLALLVKHLLYHLQSMFGVIFVCLSIHLPVVVGEPLVQRRAFQGAVVHVDADGFAVIEEQGVPTLPVFRVERDGKDGILVCLTFEHELSLGYGDAVHQFGGQLVFQIDHLAIFLAHTLDGVLHLLSLGWLLCLCRHSQQQDE